MTQVAFGAGSGASVWKRRNAPPSSHSKVARPRCPENCGTSTSHSPIRTSSCFRIGFGGSRDIAVPLHVSIAAWQAAWIDLTLAQSRLADRALGCALRSALSNDATGNGGEGDQQKLDPS